MVDNEGPSESRFRSAKIAPNPRAEAGSCCAELAGRRSELDEAKLALASCQANMILWPENLGDEWRIGGVQKKVSAALDEIGAEGEAVYHCDEFPCIVRLPETADRDQFEQALRNSYGEGAYIDINQHGAIGPWGVERMVFATALPGDLADEATLEHVRSRYALLIHDRQTELAAEAPDLPREHPAAPEPMGSVAYSDP